ncbi:NUDIX hydrolase [Allonocardiopsis opalescens]|uniref:ADP-ribose pyrophosphatase YjhB (NUDIX family) n=1 Tax=Allonocardiopsis opalescens TaxID=1144618 RepID=A0A2T0PTT7_9ACTN|nr:NUDIX domain-containing protein [Allonocardiopsis opalescens]PRX92313.1 ADP-ribose pyrophosphatase YjhB (NUDIX family) [Allonocardiopsis opalescens]
MRPAHPATRLRAITVHLIATTPTGRALLTPTPAGPPAPPGTELRHGEDPHHAAQRLLDELPAPGRLTATHDIRTQLSHHPAGHLHTDRILYTAALTAEAPTTADPATAADLTRHHPHPDTLAHPRTGQRRFAAYGLVTDPDDRLLLTLITDGYPGAGTWHLPGGGTDHGEDPRTALTREITEETAQHGRVGALIGIHSRYRPESLHPGEARTPWHGVWAFYRATVAHPGPVRVLDTGGSTTDARWYHRDELPGLDLSITTRQALALA